MNIRKKIISYILVTVLAVSCLSGCGGEFTDGTGKPGGAVSSGAVSGGAVSGGAVSDEPVSEENVSGGAVKKEDAGEDVQARRPFCNGNCGYFEVEEGIIAQFSLKDGKKKTYEVPGMFDLLYVGEDELIYWVDTEELGLDAFYTVPIVSKADGTEELKTAEAKQVPGVPDALDYGGAVYADGQYIIYCREGKAEVRCYNRKTGQTSEMPMPGELKEMVGDDFLETKRIGDCLYFWISKQSIICWQMDDNKVYSYTGEESGMVMWVYTKDGVFANEDSGGGIKDAVFIDVIDRNRAKIISKAEVDRLLAKELGDVRYWSMSNLFLDGGRVYAQVYVEWVENKTCYVQRVVLSRKSDGSGELKYERKLTEELVAVERKAAGQKDEPLKRARDGLGTDDISGIEKVQYYHGYCIVFDGKAYLVIGEDVDDKEETETSACYDLKSGVCRAVKRGDWEYYVADILREEG